MNAHTGILWENINLNGLKLLNFAENYSLEILNHTLGRGRVTWSFREHESVINYILVNAWGRAKVLNMWADEEGVLDIDSEHNMLC